MAEVNCSGDCMTCNAAQRIYCAAQHCHVILENQRLIIARLDELQSALLSDVTSTESEAGADNRASIKSRTSKKKGEKDEL